MIGELVYEEWRYVKGLEGQYLVSNRGRIISLNFNKKENRWQLLSLFISNGYVVATLYVKHKMKRFYVHRLLGEAFIPNPHCYPQIHHLDAIRNNCVFYNLVWSTQSMNVQFEYDDGRRVGKTNMKGRFGENNPGSLQVKMLTMDGRLIKVIPGVSEAARVVNGSASHITKVCKGKLNYHKGYRWSYA